MTSNKEAILHMQPLRWDTLGRAALLFFTASANRLFGCSRDRDQVDLLYVLLSGTCRLTTCLFKEIIAELQPPPK